MCREAHTLCMTTQHTQCSTCENVGNPENFGNCCDPCDTARKVRLETAAQILKQYNQQNTQLGKALRYHGYGK